jgi:hypothetical protein
LHEKGGKEHDVPCHHRLDQYLHDCIEAADIADDLDGYLFHTAHRKTGRLSTKPFSSRTLTASSGERALKQALSEREEALRDTSQFSLW